jgi:hypothetical protein
MVRYITNPNYKMLYATPNNNSNPVCSNNGKKFDAAGKETDTVFTIKVNDKDKIPDKIPELALFNGKYYFIVSNRWARAYTEDITKYINNKTEYYTNPYWDKKTDKTYTVKLNEWVKEPYDYGTNYKHVPKIYF